MTWKEDERRSACLLFSEELRSGRVTLDDILVEEVRSAVRARRRPSAPARIAQRIRMKRGTLSYEGETVSRMTAARRAVLGSDADGAARLLIRVDEFPHYLAGDEPERYGTERFKRFHALLMEHGMPYLIAVPPRISAQPLDPTKTAYRRFDETELEQLAALRADGVSFALHGLDHRTRDARPRHHSELAGLSLEQTEQLLETALAELGEAGIEPEIFIPPYNRFDAAQYELLARRFCVVCGGPENVLEIGFHHTPRWRGDAVWLPTYHPLYGSAAEVLPMAQKLAERRTALWTPVVLHWGWEADAGWTALERFAEQATRWTSHWDLFLDAVAHSR